MKVYRRNIVLAIQLAASILLASCKENVLDFRNSEISNGKIYATGQNTGFSGKVTNLPINKIPLDKIRPFIGIIYTITKDDSYNTLLWSDFFGGFGDIRYSKVLCDANTKDGSMNGEVICGAYESIPLLKITYKDGIIDGAFTVYNYKNKDSIIAEAMFDNGKITGKSVINSFKTGKIIHTANWKNGIAEGVEQAFDETSGNVTFRGNIINGKYDGDASRYSAEGKLIETSTYKNGVLQPTSQSVTKSVTSVEQCVDAWVVAYRKEQGADAIVTADQSSEWEGLCKEGKTPN